jgi:hypothetical protein
MIGPAVRSSPKTVLLERLGNAGALSDPVDALDSAIRQVGAVRHLAGEVAGVVARVAHGAPRRPAIATDLRALVALATGATATVEASCLAPLRERTWGVAGRRRSPARRAGATTSRPPSRRRQRRVTRSRWRRCARARAPRETFGSGPRGRALVTSPAGVHAETAGDRIA